MPSKIFPGIPEPNRSVDGMFEPLQRVKEICEILTGQRGNSAAILAGADLDDVIAYANTQLKLKAPLTALPTNLILNPAFSISQENGTTASGTNAYYPADEWNNNINTSTGVVSAQNVVVNTPKGAQNRLRFSCATVDTSIAAGEYWTIAHNIEGIKTVQLQWGTANAKPLIVRFGFKGPVGTYCASVRNSAGDRSYVREFVIAAAQSNTDTEQILIFPGDTAGTWLKDNGVGIRLNIALALGSSFQTTPNAWQAGNFVGSANQLNGYGLNTNVFEIFDFGGYNDFFNTGVAPSWEWPQYDLELIRCKRYWQTGNTRWQGFATNAALFSVVVEFPVEFRAAPTITQTNVFNSSFPVGTNQSDLTPKSFLAYRTANASAGGHFVESWVGNARL